MNARPILLLIAAFASSCAGTSSNTQDVDWFKSGYYAGILFGKASSNASGSDIDSDLAKLGYASSTRYDGRDSAWTAYGGYRFEKPFAVELSYKELGQVESTISAMPSDVDAFLAKVARVHPYLGRGVGVSGSWFFVSRERFELFASGGLWYWDAQVRAVAATGESVDIDESGVDLTLGLGALIALTDRFDLRVGVNRFFLDDFEGDVLWIGLQGSVDDLVAAIRGE